MNATQLKYARDPLDSALSDKLTVLRNKRSAGFSRTQELAALKKGEFTINKRAENMSDAIVYTNAPKQMSDEDYYAADAALCSRAMEIKDELILGDQEAALALIQAFRSEA